jgi:hypothetical protein
MHIYYAHLSGLVYSCLQVILFSGITQVDIFLSVVYRRTNCTHIYVFCIEAMIHTAEELPTLIRCQLLWNEY